MSASWKPSLQQRFARHVERLLAVRAQPARQALRDDQADRGRDGVGLHAHVDQARQGLRRIVGMQRGEHQVAGLRRLDGDLRGLEVADLADHDDVRVLAQEGAQRRGEGQADLGVDVDLVDARQLDFRRVLGGRDVGVFAVEDIEAGVQRHGLAAAGGAGHQDHALRLGQVLEVQLLLERLVAQRIDAEHALDGIENTQHDLLAEQRRAGADAEVDGAGLRQPHLDAAVLRHAALGDVEPRHDLEARGDLAGELHRRLRDFLQHAVQAEADAVTSSRRARSGCPRRPADGVQQDLVDEAHDGRVFDVVAGDLVAELVVAAR